jgi:hypothetical protein
MSSRYTNNIPQVPNSGQELNWINLIEDAEEEVNSCQIKIQKLTKAIVFFKKQSEAKIPFPTKTKINQKDTSNIF